MRPTCIHTGSAPGPPSLRASCLSSMPSRAPGRGLEAGPIHTVGSPCLLPPGPPCSRGEAPPSAAHQLPRLECREEVPWTPPGGQASGWSVHMNLTLVLSKMQALLPGTPWGLPQVQASIIPSLMHSFTHPHSWTRAPWRRLLTARALGPRDSGQAQTLSSCDERQRLSWAQQPYLSQSLRPAPQPRKRKVRATGGPSRLQQFPDLWPPLACPVGAGPWVEQGQEGISPKGRSWSLLSSPPAETSPSPTPPLPHAHGLSGLGLLRGPYSHLKAETQAGSETVWGGAELGAGPWQGGIRSDQG